MEGHKKGHRKFWSLGEATTYIITGKKHVKWSKGKKGKMKEGKKELSPRQQYFAERMRLQKQLEDERYRLKLKQIKESERKMQVARLKEKYHQAKGFLERFSSKKKEGEGSEQKSGA